ncbi:MAG: ABC transporter substrate-binding protein [Eubacteriales bacterium]|nr:ABC transporter substrate-binding protein [Eubacteriales bacterium]
MKVTINQNSHIKETEIIINCTSLDGRIRNLASFIQQYSTSLEGRIDEEIYYVPLDSILYLDCADKKTFFYDCHRVFWCRYTLAELEEKLGNALFVRISKNCIVNIAFISRICPYENHRLKVIMKNGEHLIAARFYKDALKERLQDFNADILYITAALEQKDCFEHYPEASVYNAGKMIRFASVPNRIVALSFENAELLAALGLAGKIVGIAPAECGIEQVAPEYQEALRSIPLITHCDHGAPFLAEITALHPDLVLGNYYSLRTLQRTASSKPADWGMNLYVMECTVPGRATVEELYRDFLKIGRIFHVEDRALRLVEDMRRKISVLTHRVVYQTPVPVFVYDGSVRSPYTSGAGTIEQDLISISGGVNVFGGLEGAYQPVTWEQVAEAGPEVILVHDYIDRMDAEEKIKLLKERPELQEVPAVKENRFVRVSLLEAMAGIQNVSLVEKLVNSFHPDVL